MAVMFEDSLKKDISSKNLCNCYMLFGDDAYLKNMYLSKLSTSVASKDDVFNYQKFSADCDLQEVYDAVVQFPMMADKKCVIIDDYDFEKADKTDFERLCEMLSEDYETTLIILCFTAVEVDSKKSEKAKKLIAAVEKGGGKAIALNHRKTPELAKMLMDGAAKRGCKLEQNAAYYLIEVAGDDISTLVNELDKLCCYAPASKITKETVDKVSVKTVEASVYNLTRDIMALKTAEAIKTVDELMFMRIEPMIILHTIASAYVEMYRVYIAKKNGISLNELANELGYQKKIFVLERAASNLNKMSFRKLSLSLEALIEADSKLKSFSSDGRVIIEQLVIRLIYIIAKGEKID